MKAENRKRLFCRKHIKGNVYDSFTAVVMAINVDSAVKEFERQGYTVTKLN